VLNPSNLLDELEDQSLPITSILRLPSQKLAEKPCHCLSWSLTSLLCLSHRETVVT